MAVAHRRARDYHKTCERIRKRHRPPVLTLMPYTGFISADYY